MLALFLTVCASALAASDAPPSPPPPAAQQPATQSQAPEAVAERERSRSAYRRQAPAQALATARRWHPEATVEPLWAPIDPPPGQTVKRYLDDHAALIETEHEGHFAIAESLLPLRTDAGPGPAVPVDPTLEPMGGGYEPAHPLAGLRLPESLSDGISLPDIGVSVKPVGAELAASGISADDRVFWSGFATDTDLIAEPLPGGVEVSAQLRSAESPERIVLDFDLPAGATLAEGADGGPVEIVRDDRRLATIAPPVAWDADGVDVPVTYEVIDSRLAVDIDHRGRDLLYPILLDPPVLEDHRYWSSDSSLNQSGWRFRGCENAFYPVKDGALTTKEYGRGLYIFRDGFASANPDWCDEWFWSYYNWEPYGYIPGGSKSVFIYGASFYQFRIDNDPAHCGTVGLTDGYFGGGWRDSYRTCSDVGYVNRTVCAAPGCAANVSPAPGADVGGNIARMTETSTEGDTGIDSRTYIGGALLYINDLVAPTVRLSTRTPFPDDPANAELVDSVNRDVVLDGGDPQWGIGVKTFQLDFPGTSETRVRSSSCDGTVGNRCDFGVDSDDSSVSGDSFTINTAELPEGVRRIDYQAKDAVGNASPRGSFYIKVDHNPPTLTLDGSLYDHRGETLASGAYRLDIAASDAGPAGLKSIEVDVDGRQQLYVDESCGPNGCCGITAPDAVDKGCNEPAMAEYHFLPDEHTPGEHLITVRVRDALDHVETQSFPVTVREGSADCVGVHADAQRSVAPQQTDTCSAVPEPPPRQDPFDGSCVLDGSVSYEVESGYGGWFPTDYWTLDAAADGSCSGSLNGEQISNVPAVLALRSSYDCRALQVNLDDGSSGDGSLTFTKGTPDVGDDTSISLTYQVIAADGSSAADRVLRLAGTSGGQAAGLLRLTANRWGTCFPSPAELHTELQTAGALEDDE